MTDKNTSFRLLFNRVYFSEYNPVRKAAQDFGVSLWTVKRWYTGKSKPPASVLKLLLVMHRGYLPDDPRWMFFKIDAGRGVMITPQGREFRPCELESFAYHMDRYHTLEKMYGAQVSLDDTVKRSGLASPQKPNTGPVKSKTYPNAQKSYRKIFHDFDLDMQHYMDGILRSFSPEVND